jgi:proline dehydrogenase
MLDVASKAFFQTLSHSQTLKGLASRYGMSGTRAFATRFIAGETVDAAIEAVRQIQSQGLLSTLDYLGESVTSLAEADTATREYLQLIEAVDRAGIERNLSLKLTQLGLDVDRAICVDNLRKILRRRTNAIFLSGSIWRAPPTRTRRSTSSRPCGKLGHHNAGIVLQTCLHRTGKDFERVNALGARIRLVKGAYREPKSVAFQLKADVDDAYLTLAKRLLTEGVYPAIATHDPQLLDAVKRFAAERAISQDAYEFQLLYGIRRDLQNALRDAGYRVRVYVPFGREWFPYFMRRLGERPANVAFVVRSLFAER